MAKELDIIIFGATGYTGSYCIRNLIKLIKNEGKVYKFGIAGRNESKLIETLESVCKEVDYDSKLIKIIIADVFDDESLRKMTKQCRVLTSVVGPYSLYGRQVVEACIETNTHYLDISGEPQFLEKVHLDLDESAKNKKVFVIGACGFDSIPADCGTMLLKDSFKNITFDEVEAFIVFDPKKGYSVNHGTFDSLIESFVKIEQMKQIRNQLYPKLSKKSFVPRKKMSVHYLPITTPLSNGYFMPFWQTDKSVVKRTQLINYDKDDNDTPVQFREYIMISHWILYFIITFGFAIFLIASQFNFTRNLLKRYPKFFSFGMFSQNGPTKEQVKNSTFAFLLQAKGWMKNSNETKENNVTKVLEIKGPEAAYDATSLMLLTSAITIIEDLDNEQNRIKCGVTTPGIAFRNTKLIDRLCRNGMEWNIIENTTKASTIAFKSCRLSSSKIFDYQYLEKSDEPTDKYQNEIKKLPIPNLEDTCSRYLSAVQPLIANQNQFNDTVKYVNDFEKLHGKQLDHELRKRYEKITDSTYFNDDWLESYLKYRGPILINFNPYLILKDHPNSSLNDPVLRATNLIISTLRYRRSLIDNCLSCEKIDIRSYKNLFSTTRIPKVEQDELKYFGNNKKHIVFLKEGQFFNFKVLNEEGNIKPADEILSYVSSLYKLKLNPKEPSITAFTADERNKWAKIREEIANISETNKENLGIIDSALFLVCLDTEDFSPVHASNKSLGFLHGTYNPDSLLNADNHNKLNRWFDKSIQLIISKNGNGGINFEHSWGDGILLLNALNKIFSDSLKNTFVTEDCANNTDVLSTKLNFTLNPILIDELCASISQYRKFVSTVKMSVVTYDNMDRNYLKTKKISPDFVFQLAFQMAQYKIYSTTAATYEACSTAKFKSGRTETIRSATMQTKNACKAMAWGEKKFNFMDLRQILIEASLKHQEISKLAANGQGCDRHLFALNCLAKKLHISTPQIFTDPTYEFANKFTLSTSNLYANNVISGGYGPVVLDGFGLAYGFIDDGLNLNCSSFDNKDATQFSEAFIDSLKEINNVLERS